MCKVVFQENIPEAGRRQLGNGGFSHSPATLLTKLLFKIKCVKSSKVAAHFYHNKFTLAIYHNKFTLVLGDKGKGGMVASAWCSSSSVLTV